MTKRALNVYEAIFAAFFVLKLAKYGAIGQWHWFWVLLPFLLGLMHSFFSKVFEKTGMSRELNVFLRDEYVTARKNKIISHIKKQQQKENGNNRRN